MKKIIYILMLIIIIGCSKAEKKTIEVKDKSSKVVIYSGGNIVGSWESDGKVIKELNTDGYYFVDKKTNQLVQITGTIIVTTN